MASQTPKANKQLLCMQKGGPFQAMVVTVPLLEPDQVLVRNSVIAFNPLDLVQRDFGIFVTEWPFLIGIEGAGVVEAVGSSVVGLHPGDEVMYWAGGIHQTDPIRGAFQDYVVVPSYHAARKPANISLKDAASLPVCYYTAVLALIDNLNIPLAYLPNTPNNGTAPASILVLGGSSAVGAAAIQLLRLTDPYLPILATSSAKHHAHLRSLGASQVFDYHQASIVSDIKAASPNGQGVDVILDCISAGATQTDICDVLKKDGQRKYSEVLTGADVSVPDNVSKTTVSAWDLVKVQGGKQALSALTKLVEEGKYKVPLPVKVVGHGLEQIANVLDEVKTVSGQKLTLTL